MLGLNTESLAVLLQMAFTALSFLALGAALAFRPEACQQMESRLRARYKRLDGFGHKGLRGTKLHVYLLRGTGAILLTGGLAIAGLCAYGVACVEGWLRR